jgi:HK97 gp10 family phage protein
LPEEVQVKILEAAIEEAAKLLESEAKRRAPYRTGKLRDSIEARKVKPRRGEAIRYAISPHVKYAAPVEYGTSRMPPNPYMRPAHDTKKDQVVRDAREDVTQGIERLVESKG